jgi:4'-phosphopantetheinyl transferase
MAWPPHQDPEGKSPAVTVWWAWRSKSDASDLSVLSDEERGRVERLHLAPDRERSALARVLLRFALAERFGGAPEEFAISWDRGPSIDIASRTWLSLAHSGDAVAVALSAVGPVGVDVEGIERAADMQRRVEERVFTAAERDMLDRLDPEASALTALQLWTHKEALLKACGDGLSRAPASVEVLGLPETAELRRFDGRTELVGSTWLRPLALPETVRDGGGHVGSLVVLTGAPVEVVERDASELFAARS